MRLGSQVVSSRKCGQIALLNRFSNAIARTFCLLAWMPSTDRVVNALRAGNDGKHPRNMGAELRHEVAEEGGHRVVYHFTVCG